ncbi:MAG: tetratricopeptide repeat protein [Planctomycetota bacterium]
MLRLGSPLLVRGVAAVSLTALAGTAFALPQDQDSFFRAYYLEHEAGDLSGALELYRAAAADRKLSKDDRARAARYASACEEELAARDLARLVPEDTILYVEFNEPGDQLGRLLDQLGLLQGSEHAGGIAVSPSLLEGTLGLRGAAVAVTRIDPTGGMPGGVLILHPGDMHAVRGMIETALPAGGAPMEDIGGHPTYSVEGMAFVTIADRMIVASTERELIEGVLGRVHGDTDDSLAEHPDLESSMALRGQDLGFFCFNAEPVLPLAQTMMAALAAQEPQAAMALGLLDIQSMRAVAGRLGVGDDGLSMDVSLQLDEGHQNLAFNLMRMPHVGESTFHLVPEGVAFFAASSLNQRQAGGTGVTDAQGRPVVTWMDLGREIFGNIVDVAVFSLPSMSSGPNGQPMPDAALAMTVNDADRSKAIWHLLLGIAQGATGTGDTKGSAQKMGGMRVDRFDIEEVSLYLFAHEDRVVISPSQRAIEAAVGAAKGSSVAGDPAFAELVTHASKDHTSVLGVSLGRCASVAKAVMPPRELREVAPYLDLLQDAAFTATTRHSDTQLSWSARLTGLPNVGPMVEQLVRAQMNGGARRTATVAATPKRAKRGTVAAAPESKSRPKGKRPGGSVKADAASLGDLQAAFRRLANEGQTDGAAALIPAIAGRLGEDANELNSFAWNVISSEGGGAYAKALLPVAQRANELTGNGNWYYLDTLAHVEFALGHVEKAVETQKKAVQIAHENRDARGRDAMRALQRFEKALGQDLDLN